jgi:hypothetical protein
MNDLFLASCLCLQYLIDVEVSTHGSSQSVHLLVIKSLKVKLLLLLYKIHGWVLVNHRPRIHSHLLLKLLILEGLHHLMLALESHHMLRVLGHH